MTPDARAAGDRRRMEEILAAAGDVYVAPSLLSADFCRLAEEAEDARRAGADLLHVDCMDGHFVPNLTIGPLVVGALRRATDLPLDVHLMISDPGAYADAFLEAGSDILTFHVEAVDDPVPILRKIRAAGAVAALAISPDTPVERVRDHLDEVGMILIMSVHPGFAGQSFLEQTMDKVRTLRQWTGPDFLIEVDGGISPATVGVARAAGANVLVAGSAVFGRPDRAAAVADLRRAATLEGVD